jgi:outer membrane protein assembly factor BamE (lipoprotein component of BamABCDE complex)
MKRVFLGVALFATLAFYSACSNVGSNFDTNLVKQIQNGKTTIDDVEKLLGPPYKRGIQNGNQVWTYEYDQYRALGEKASKDLAIAFDSKGVVKSHQVMSSQPLP